MAYFIYNLILCLVLSTCLFVLLIYRLRINREQKNRHPAGYLLPVVIAAVFVILTLQLTVPRILDSFSLINSRYSVLETTLNETQISDNSIIIENKTYFFNNFNFEPEPDVYYKILSTARSRYIISMTQITEGKADVVSTNN
jgi:glucan phosphoethanolaminetransferase (alkaline phosphatase superfamily)